MTSVTQACADCLEEAGGRQQQHKITWEFGMCGCCGKRKAITEPENFGSPRLAHYMMELEPSKESA